MVRRFEMIPALERVEILLIPKRAFSVCHLLRSGVPFHDTAASSFIEDLTVRGQAEATIEACTCHVSKRSGINSSDPEETPRSLIL
jgi:hypothetical protein